MDGQEPFPLEECRAECVSLHLGTAPDVQGIFGFVGEVEAESLFAHLHALFLSAPCEPSPTPVHNTPLGPQPNQCPHLGAMSSKTTAQNSKNTHFENITNS